MNFIPALYVFKVTIGICVRNSEATVGAATKSVINQDFPHELMEIIIVDGYSEDNTLKIIEKNLGNQIKSRIFYENEGLGAARQIVVDSALGEYIVWVDGDMVLSKDFIRQQVDFMDRNSNVGIGKGKYGLKSVDEKLVSMLENTEFLISTMVEGESNSKCHGTSGCIYRTLAIRQVGGFKKTIQGAGEDVDAEYRIKLAGWKIYVTMATFFEKRRNTWRHLWDEYFWHGFGFHSVLSSNKDVFKLYRFLPPVAIITELLRIPRAYKLTHKKVVFLLPLHYVFKRSAWILGYLKGSMDPRTV